MQNRAGKTVSNCVLTTGILTSYNKDNILIGNIRPYLKKIGLQQTRAEQMETFLLSSAMTPLLFRNIFIMYWHPILSLTMTTAMPRAQRCRAVIKRR